MKEMGMSIEKQIMVTVANVEVADDWGVELTVRDPLTLRSVTVSLTWALALDLADELGAAVVEASLAVAADAEERAAQGVLHGFDADAMFDTVKSGREGSFCSDRGEGGMVCTLVAGHSGTHAAQIVPDGAPIGRWPAS